MAARLFARYRLSLVPAAEQVALDLIRLRLRLADESLVLARQRLVQAALGESKLLASNEEIAQAISAAAARAFEHFGWARVLRGRDPLSGAWRRRLIQHMRSILQERRSPVMPTEAQMEQALARIRSILQFPPPEWQAFPRSNLLALRQELWRQHQERVAAWEAILQERLTQTHAVRTRPWMRLFGLSPVTVEEALRLGLARGRTTRIVGLEGTQEVAFQEFLEQASRSVPGFAQMAFDPLVLKDVTGQVVDLRFLRSIEEHAYRVASSFRVPFLNFSLPQIVRWDLWRDLRRRASQVRIIPAGSLQMLEALTPEARQELRRLIASQRGMTAQEARGVWATAAPMVRIGSDVYLLERPGEPVARGVMGASPYSLIGQLIARMMGLHPQPQAASRGISGRLRSLLDLGFQPMPSIFAQVRSAIAKYWAPDSDLQVIEQIRRAGGPTDPTAIDAARRLRNLIYRARRPLPPEAMAALEPYLERTFVAPAVAEDARALLDYLRRTHPQLAAQLRHQLATAAPDLASLLETHATSDATLRQLLDAYQRTRALAWSTVRMGTEQDVLRMFEILGAENIQHPWRTDDYVRSMLSRRIASEWRAYVYDPHGFLESRRVITRRIPQIAAIGEFLPQDIEEIPRIEDVKMLLQHEMLRRIEGRLPASPTLPTPLLSLTPSIPSSARPAWRLAVLDYWTSHAAATLDEQATFLAQAVANLPENSTVLNELRRVVRSEVPWYAAKRYTPPPERLLTEGQWVTPELLIRRPFRPPSIREHLAALGGDMEAAARVRAGWSAFFRQFVAGRESPEYVTSATLVPYFLMSRINEALAFFGLGLSPAWTGSALRIWGGLTLLRWLPAIALPFYAGYLDWELENLTGFSPKKAIARSLAGLHILSAKARDMLGITSLAKELQPLFPGSELIWEIPGLSFFDPTKSAEEVAWEYEHGRFPIRRGRWWLLSSSPIQGERIETFAPSWLRQLESDYYIRGVYGSREEYYRYAAFPTPRNPLAPLRHFITEPYHWEERWYRERPYPVTGPIPELHEIPIVGPIVSATVGRLLKPPRRMHVAEVERWAQLAALYEQGMLSPEQEPPPGAGAPVAYAYITPAGLVSIRQARGERGAPLEEIPSFINQIPVRTPRGQLYPISVQASPAGPSVSGYGLAPGPASARAQARALAYGVGTAAGAPAGDLVSEKAHLTPVRLVQEVPYEELAAAELARRARDPHSMRALAAESLYRATEWAGLYGWLAQTFMGGQPIERMVRWQPATFTSYARSWWNLGAGGLGGEFSEILRRFVPREPGYTSSMYPRVDLMLNPIRNTMPSWLPSNPYPWEVAQPGFGDYFIDFSRGDPYARIFRGEMRLPGPGYEALYGRPEVYLSPSYVNRSVPELVALLLGYRKPLTEFGEFVTERGNEIHREYQRYWKKQGVLLGAEVPVEVPELGIRGHIDALLATSEGPMVVDIKSMSQERFEKALERGAPYEEHQRQVWMYQWMTGYTKTPGGLMYVSRDTGEEAWFEFPYNEQAVYEELAKFQLARLAAQRMIEEGIVSPYEAYPPLERYKILSSVAPWSEERRYYEQLLSSMRDELSEEEWREFQQAKREARERRRRLRVFPYRFRYADLQKEAVTIARWIDANTFLTEEHPEQPMRLAGLYVPQAKGDEVAEAAAAYLAQELPPGTRITIGYAADELRRYGQDQLKTLRVTVWKGLKNINRDLIERGLARERERDYSPAGIHARFSPSEILLGKMWERLAHFPSPLHSKFLPVRSPLEEYERRDVFGKRYQRWEHPIRDFVLPTLESIAAYPLPEAMVVGGILGMAALPILKGQSPWRGFKVGAAFGAALSLARMGYEAMTGQAWIPPRRRREREVELYFQALEYLKYRGLYEYARRRALEEEGIDVEAFFRRMRGRRRFTKAKREELLEEKRRLIEEGRAENAERIAEINEELEELSGWRELIPLTPWFASALYYRQRYESTVWGADPYRSDYATIMRALPAKEREYFVHFVEAPPQERRRIERIAPVYLRRFLQARWGRPVEDLPSLQEFFKTHYLPPPDWEGWDVHHDLQDVKVKTLRREGFELSEFGYWEQDEKRAEYLKAPALPYSLPTERLQDLEGRLRAILQGQGLTDVQVQITPSSYPGVRVYADVMTSRHDAIRDYVREHLAELVRS